MDKKTKIIAISLIALMIIGILVNNSLNAQKEIEKNHNEFTKQWVERDKKIYIDFKSFYSSNLHVNYGKQMKSSNKMNILPSHLKYKKITREVLEAEAILESISNEFEKSKSINDSEFSIKAEQEIINSMNSSFNKLSKDYKKLLTSVKYNIDIIQESLDVIKDYSSSYYVPIETSHLIPTQFRFPLSTDVTDRYRSSIATIADKTTWEPIYLNDDEDIRQNQTWNESPYGLFSWGRALKAYSIDLNGDSSISSISDSLNLSTAFKDIFSGIDSDRKKIDVKDPNSMSDSEISNGIIDSLGSAYYEKAIQDTEPSINSILTPSQNASWIVQQNNKVILKASFNHLNKVIDANNSIASFNMIDDKTKKEFDITISNLSADSYRIEGNTPIGKLDNIYTKKVKIAGKDNETKKEEEKNNSKSPQTSSLTTSDLDKQIIESFCQVFNERAVTNMADDYTASYLLASSNEWRYEDSTTSLITAKFLSTTSDSNDKVTKFNMRDNKTGKEFVLSFTPNSDWDGYRLEGDTPIGKIYQNYVLVSSNKNQKQDNNNKQKDNTEGSKETDDPTGDKTLQGDTHKDEDASNPFN